MDTIHRYMERLRAAAQAPEAAERLAQAREPLAETAAVDEAPPRVEPRIEAPPPPGAEEPGARGAPAAPIGAILVESGRLREEDAEAVLREQAVQGAPFGTVAQRMGLATQADIDFALARQFEYPLVPADGGVVAPAVIAAYEPDGAVVEHLRLLRSQLALSWAGAKRTRKALAITGVGRGDGRSFVAANLAVLFAQMGARTLLIDADLRHPAQHLLFRIDNRLGLSSLLVGRAAGEAIVRIAPLRNLFVLPAGPRPPNPQELLGRALFARQLRSLEGLFDVVIVDTTAAEAGADGQLVAAAAGAAILVVRQDVTPVKELTAFHATLGAAGSRAVGAVVNRR